MLKQDEVARPVAERPNMLSEYALWCASFDDTPRRPTMYAKMCWWHDKAILLEKSLIDSELRHEADRLRIQGLRDALGNLCMEVESMESLDGRVSNEAWKAKERAEALLSEEKKS